MYRPFFSLSLIQFSFAPWLNSCFPLITSTTISIPRSFPLRRPTVTSPIVPFSLLPTGTLLYLHTTVVLLILPPPYRTSRCPSCPQCDRAVHLHRTRVSPVARRTPRRGRARESLLNPEKDGYRVTVSEEYGRRTSGQTNDQLIIILWYGSIV